MNTERPVIRIPLGIPYIFIIWLIVSVVIFLVSLAISGQMYGTANLLRILGIPMVSVLAIFISLITMIIAGVRASEREGNDKKKPRRRLFTSLLSIVLILIFSVVALFTMNSYLYSPHVYQEGSIDATLQSTVVF